MSKNWYPQHSDSPKEQSGVALHQQSVQSFSGPLPPPAVLKEFNQIVPGAAGRIIKMAEGQFTHRTEIEKKVIDSDISRSKWGQVLGFIIAILGLLVSLITILRGQEVSGSIIGGGTLVSLVSVFMYGTKSRKKEREAKAQE